MSRPTEHTRPSNQRFPRAWPLVGLGAVVWLASGCEAILGIPMSGEFTVAVDGGTSVDVDAAVAVDAAGPAIDASAPGLLSALRISGPAAPDLEFDPTRLVYEVDVSLLRQKVQLTATAAGPDVQILVAGAPVESGVPSAPLLLALGENPIDVTARHSGGEEQTYRVTVRRAAEIVQRAYVKASNTGAGDHLGESMALWGDLLAVGAPQEDSAARGVDGEQANDGATNSGAVYVFRRSGDAWIQEAYLKAANADAYDEFGISVALWEDTLAVGAWGERSGVVGDDSDNSLADCGAAYVFRRTGDGAWEQEAYLKASNPGAGDELGWSLALWDDTLAVAAPQESSNATGVDGEQDNDDAPGSGAVYVFRRTGGAWGQEAYLKASNAESYDMFGLDVALRGHVLAVGAGGEDSAATGVNGDEHDENAPESGAVYVFRRSGETWAQEAYLKAFNTGADDEFGRSVALEASTLAVGAPREDSGATGVDGDEHDESVRDSGAVYVFGYVDEVWSRQAYLKAADPGIDDQFGYSVALVNDTLAVGAPHFATPANRGGAVYVFQRASGLWAQSARSAPVSPENGDRFGHAVALSEDTLVAGAPGEDSARTGVNGDAGNDDAAESGAGYVFH